MKQCNSMVQVIRLIFLFSLLFFQVSCDNSLGKPKKNASINTHNYTSEPVNTTTPQAEEEEKINGDLPVRSETRDIWQEPLKVIKQLGDLEGKTLADIGAGPFGYFTFPLAGKTKLSKVLAIDIDTSAINFIEKGKTMIPKEFADKIETRLVTPDNARLKKGEADIVLIVNTSSYFDDRVAYFKNLKEGIAANGRLVIIDFKMKRGPHGPPLNSRIPLGVMEQELAEAGYTQIFSDDTTLQYQYIVIATQD